MGIVMNGVTGRMGKNQHLVRSILAMRRDGAGRPYHATAEDAAYATFELDGTDGSAVAGLRWCRVQHRAMTPRPVWNPDAPSAIDFRALWAEVTDHGAFDHAFRAQWALFLRHAFRGAPFRHTLLDGANGVQLAELGLASWRERRWFDVSELRP